MFKADHNFYMTLPIHSRLKQPGEAIMLQKQSEAFCWRSLSAGEVGAHGERMRTIERAFFPFSAEWNEAARAV